MNRKATTKVIKKNNNNDSNLLNSFCKANFNQKNGIETDTQRRTPRKTKSKYSFRLID